jgi:hydroxymethylglutaryl-CoA synthase
VNARIVAVGAAAPALRLPAAAIAEAWGRTGGRGQVAVCAPDEDTLTLAWDAGSRALEAAGLDPAAVDGLWWGTSRPPFAEGPSHSFLAAALGLAPESGGALLAGSTHSGIDAFAAAADAVAAGSARLALVIASDALLPGTGTGAESRCGAGAAAVVLAAEGGAGSVGARITRHIPVVDRYRGDADIETRDLYDGRLFREEIFLPLATAVIEPLATLEPRAWSLPDPDGRLGATLAKRAGSPTPPSASVYAEVGDTGAAAALLGAIGSLDAAGTVAIVAYGGGRATAVAVNVERPVPGATSVARLLSEGRDISYTEALRARGQLVPAGETIPMGVPPESAMFVRGAEEMLGLLGGRCVDCGTISTPPSIHPHCVACGGPKLEPVALARHGTVHTYVINYTMPAPFVAPLPLAVLDLDDGARLMLQVVGDGAELAIGRSVRLVLRRYAYERGVPVYGFKAKPVTSEEGSAMSWTS